MEKLLIKINKIFTNTYFAKTNIYLVINHKKLLEIYSREMMGNDFMTTQGPQWPIAIVHIRPDFRLVGTV